MGFIFGKYGLYVEFYDGTAGYIMDIRGDHAMVTSSFANAEKFMSESKAIEYARSHDILSCSNSNCSGVKDVYLSSDGKLFRMG